MRAAARTRARSAAEASGADTLTTGEMARLSNNTLRTVRFYEEAGILTPVGRTDGGHRVFERHQLDRLMLVSDMREAGLPLEQIRTLLETKQNAQSGGDAADAAVTSLCDHIAHLKVKIELLSRLATDLEQTVAAARSCVGCIEPDLFPHRCGACGRMGRAEDQPRGMRVLWSLAGSQKKKAEDAGGDR